MTFGKIHDAPEFRIRCLPRDKQTSTVFLDALGKDSSALTGDRFRLQWVSLYASEIAAVPFVSGLEVGQSLFRNPFCKHVYTPVITLTRDAGLFHMALAVFLPLMDGNGFSTDLVKAYAISDGHSRLRNDTFKVCSPDHCPAAALPLHTDEETLTLLGIETVSGSAELKNSQSCVCSALRCPLLLPESVSARRMALPGLGSQPVDPLLFLKLLLQPIAAQTVQDELVEDAAGHVLDEQVSEAEILHGLFPLFHTFLPQAFALVLALLFFALVFTPQARSACR